jgi:hypothetical protein
MAEGVAVALTCQAADNALGTQLYPSRVYSAGITVVIATLPILLNHNLFLWPSRVLDWFGSRPLRDLSFATLAAFYGVALWRV